MQKKDLPLGFLEDLEAYGIVLPDEVVSEMTTTACVAPYEVPLGAKPQSRKRRKKKKRGRIKEGV